jgi:UPF0271 protein
MPMIDLNADLGEECADDAALLSIVTTANVAAGGHAGGGAVLIETVRLAYVADVAVGAHPSYPDRPGFGRESLAHLHDHAGIAAFVGTQVLAVSDACASHGIRLSHVKAHGALYHDAARDPEVARAFLDGVRRVVDRAPAVAVMGLPGSVLESLCAERDVPFLAEAFADRAYRPDGSLLPRREPGAVLEDPAVVAAQAVSIATSGTARAVDGSTVAVPAVTLCVHGDTPGAVALARHVRHELERNGVSVSPRQGRA